jgi:hypothetical protein
MFFCPFLSLFFQPALHLFLFILDRQVLLLQSSLFLATGEGRNNFFHCNHTSLLNRNHQPLPSCFALDASLLQIVESRLRGRAGQEEEEKGGKKNQKGRRCISTFNCNDGNVGEASFPQQQQQYPAFVVFLEAPSHTFDTTLEADKTRVEFFDWAPILELMQVALVR